MNIVFDAGLNQVNIITNFNFDLYTIKFSSSPFKDNKTIYSKTFIAIPEKPCPPEKATINSKGK